jgi:hypothetical protein
MGKTEHLKEHQWKKGDPSPNPEGRPCKFATAMRRATGYTESQVADCIKILHAMSKSELEEHIRQDDTTVLEITLGRALLDNMRSAKQNNILEQLRMVISPPKVTTEARLTVETKQHFTLGDGTQLEL